MPRKRQLPKQNLTTATSGRLPKTKASSPGKRRKQTSASDYELTPVSLISGLTGKPFHLEDHDTDTWSTIRLTPLDGSLPVPEHAYRHLATVSKAFAKEVHDVLQGPDYIGLLFTLDTNKLDQYMKFLKADRIPVSGCKLAFKAQLTTIEDLLQMPSESDMEQDSYDDFSDDSQFTEDDDPHNPIPPWRRGAEVTGFPAKTPAPAITPTSALPLPPPEPSTGPAEQQHPAAPSTVPASQPLPAAPSTALATLTPSTAPSTCPATLPPPESSATTVSSPTSETKEPEAATTKTPAQRRARIRYRAVDFSKLNVEVPSPEPLTTVLFRPSRPEEKLDKLHPLRLNTELESLGGPVLATRTIRKGGLAIDLAHGTDTSRLLATTTLLGVSVFASLPAAPSSCIGVLHGVHHELTTEEIMQATRTEPPTEIMDVLRMAKPGQQSWTIKVSFQGTQLPTKAFLAGRCHRIQPYKSRPLQCFNCGRFGHEAKVCRSKLRCWTCSEPHTTSTCPNKASPLCASCGDAHPADSVACPTRHFQLKISEVKQANNITFKAARAAVTKAAKEVRTYAAVAAKKPATTNVPTTSPAPANIAHPRPPAQPAFKGNTAHPRPPAQPADAATLSNLFHGLITILTSAIATSNFSTALTDIAQLFQTLHPDNSLFKLPA